MKTVKPDTIARTVVLVMALINQVLAVAGREKLPFLEDDIYQIISLGATMVASLIAWWKNNSFTRAAILADEVLKEEKQNDYWY